MRLFLTSVLLWGLSIANSSPAGAHSEQPSALCSDALTSADLYAWLGRNLPSHSFSGDLFEAIQTRPDFRKELNRLLEKQKWLKQRAQEGLRHREAFRAQLQEMSQSLPVSAVMAPYAYLNALYDQYRRELKSRRERLLRYPEAEMQARSETATRYPLAEGFSPGELEPEALDFYRRQIQRNEDSIRVDSGKNPKEDLKRFAGWLRQQQAQVRALRAEGVKRLLRSLFEADPSLLTLKNAETKAFIPFSATLSLKELEALRIDVLSMKSSPGQKETRLGFGSELSAIKEARRALGLPRNQSWRLEEGGENPVSSQSVYIRMESNDVDLNWRLLGEESVKRARHFYRVDFSDFYNVILRAIRFKRSDRARFIQNADQVLLAFQREQDLANLEEFLSESLKSPNERHFVQALTSKRFDERSALQSVNPSRLLYRLQDLSQPPVNDLASGLEWWGYALHSNYWKKVRSKTGFTIARKDPSEMGLSDFKNGERPLDRLAMKHNDWWAKNSILKIIASMSSAVSVIPLITYLTLNDHGAFHPVAGLRTALYQNQDEPPVLEMKQDERPQDIRDGKSSRFEAFHVEDYSVEKETRLHPKRQPPRYFNYGSARDLKSESEADLILLNAGDPGVSSFFESPERELSKSDGFNDSGYRVIVKSSVKYRAKNGYIAVPRPEGDYELIWLQIEGASNEEPKIRHVLLNQRTGQYFVELSRGFGDAEVMLKATFAERSGNMKYADPNQARSESELDPRLARLDLDRLERIQAKIEAAGLDSLASALSREIQEARADGRALSANRLASVISESQVYSLRPAQRSKKEDPNNPYAVYGAYLKEGRLLVKCDVSNEIFSRIMENYFDGDPDVVISALFSWVFESQKDEGNSVPRLAGSLSSVGHARARIRFMDTKRTAVFDATPVLDENGERASPWERLAQRRFERDAETAEKNTNTTHVMMPGEWNARLAEVARLNPPARQGSPGFEGDPDSHREKIAELERRTKALRELPGFRRLVYERDLFPSVRIYRAAKAVQRFAQKEFDEQELLRRLKVLYPTLTFAPWQSDGSVRSNFSQIRAYEERLWKLCVEKAGQSRHADFAWSLDLLLRIRSFEVLSLLESHHWVPIEWSLEDAASE